MLSQTVEKQHEKNQIIGGGIVSDDPGGNGFGVSAADAV
jgi:pantoate kinase